MHGEDTTFSSSIQKIQSSLKARILESERHSAQKHSKEQLKSSITYKTVQLRKENSYLRTQNSKLRIQEKQILTSKFDTQQEEEHTQTIFEQKMLRLFELRRQKKVMEGRLKFLKIGNFEKQKNDFKECKRSRITRKRSLMLLWGLMLVK